MYMYIHVREMNKEGRSKQGQTNSKAKQHSTPKVVTFPKKMSCFQRNSNPRHSTLCIDRVLYTAIYMYQGSLAGWAQIHVHALVCTVYVCAGVCRNLLAMVEVVEDCPSARAMALPTSGRIKHRAKASHDLLYTYMYEYRSFHTLSLPI